MSKLPNIIEDLDRRIIETRSQLGDSNTLLTHYLHTKLAAYLSEATYASQNLDAVRSTIVSLAEVTFGKKRLWHMENALSARLPDYSYTFPSHAFDELYKSSMCRFTATIDEHLSPKTGSRNLLEKYVYVIGPKFEWRSYQTPVDVKTAIVGNKNQEKIPFHPILASQFDLTVRVAGEVSFCQASDASAPRTVIINNVSGHFMPHHWKAVELIRILHESVGTSSEQNIVAIANDGAAVLGPLFSGG